MFVAVKTETTINIPWDAAPVPCSMLHELNRVERLSALQKKTCLNSSRGGRNFTEALTLVDTHHLFGSSRIGQKCYLLEKLPFYITYETPCTLNFSPKGVSIPLRPKGRSLLEIVR